LLKCLSDIEETFSFEQELYGYYNNLPSNWQREPVWVDKDKVERIV